MAGVVLLDRELETFQSLVIRILIPQARSYVRKKFKERILAVFKGSLTRDFRLQVFFRNQCPLGPQVFHWGRFEFFRKFAKIFANEYKYKLFRGVNDTGEKCIAGVVDTGD